MIPQGQNSMQDKSKNEIKTTTTITITTKNGMQF